MAGILNGSLLAPGTALPDGVDYAYYPDAALADGRPVVRSGGEGKYRFRGIASRAGPGGVTKPTTLNGPKFFDKAWVPSPLSKGWRINSVTLTYEKIAPDGTVLISTIYRPFPPAIASPELGLVRMLRRFFELSSTNPVGKDDSNSYLSLVEVRARDRQFNCLFGLPNEKGWLAAEKTLPFADVDVDADGGGGGAADDDWETEDARLTIEAAAGAGAMAGAANAASVCLDRRKYWGLLGGGILNGTPSNEEIVDTSGNHVPVSNWYSDSVKHQMEDPIEVITFVGNVKYLLVNGSGVFDDVANQADVLCCGLQDREGNKGTRKLAKGTSVSGKFFKAEVKALVVATAPVENFSKEARSPPEGTPSCLVFGLRLMAEHVKFSKPRKRRKVSEIKEMRAQIEAMRRIITKKNFEDLIVPCADMDACCEEVEVYIGHVVAQELIRSIPGLAGGAALTLAKKKAYASLVFDAFNAEEEEAE